MLLSLLLHLFAAAALGVATALACQAVSLPFRSGVLLGVSIYAVALAGAYVAERLEGD